ncbi:transketolase family protein [Actinomadura sp. HBU206391]|uniref:transketolase family protein n=1 Tax=Actinomadura sp. HBU206391 TaxID=2731692 RepID=UPI00164FB030|nr:transketolase C-terminal domain-containing protein [Actinomadura sp. HBU206391]MBC6461402.1 transketolase [Actinomadura sp. HBU206391]
MTEETPAGAPKATREAYRDLLAEVLPGDERLYCLDTDTGLFTGVDFGTAADRYLNLGIAEHNLMGVAAGLAASDKVPFVNTMATFAATRALEAVKIDIAYNALPVRIVATHGGLAAGHLGPTHHALEDLAIMRMLPGFTVVVPADADSTEQAVRQSLTMPGPVYLRLGRGVTAPLAAALPDGAAAIPSFEIGRAQRLRAGGDLAIVACGPHPVAAALHAAETLADRGVEAAVLNLHTLRPLDTDAIVAAARGTVGVVTVEEHWRTGGLGAAVAETLAEHAPARIIRVGMPDTFSTVVGGQEHLLQHYGITAEGVVGAARDLLGAARSSDRHDPHDPPKSVRPRTPHVEAARPGIGPNGGTGVIDGGERHEPDLPRV